MLSAIYSLALTTGANRVVKGARIEHVVGDPSLGTEKDRAYGLGLTRAALQSIMTPVEAPTLFDPAEMADRSDAPVA